MSLGKLTKYLSKPEDPLVGTRILVPVLFTDSKGNYLQRHIRPGITSQIRFWSGKGRSTNDGLDWMRNKFAQKVGHLDNIALYVWLGTCDLTTYDYRTRYISLKGNIDQAVEEAGKNLENIASIVEAYPTCKVVFLEIPPFSIYGWNKRQKHPDINQFKNQDCIIARGIQNINLNIRALNNKLQVQAPSLVQDISHNQQKNTKNRHHRESDKYNFMLYEDGLHPSGILSKVWLRKIGKQAQQLITTE